MLECITMRTADFVTRRPPVLARSAVPWHALGAHALAALIGCGGPGAAPIGDEPSTATPGSVDPGDPPSGGAEPGAGVVQPESGIYAGTYFVPVPKELEPYASFDVDSIRFEVRGAELVLQYELPALLLGDTRGLSFRGTAAADGSYVLDSDDGVATCRASDGGWTCDEVLLSVELDVDQLDRMLEPMPEADARARRSVADRFADDPIGVLRIRYNP